MNNKTPYNEPNLSIPKEIGSTEWEEIWFEIPEDHPEPLTQDEFENAFTEAKSDSTRNEEIDLWDNL